MLRYCLIRLISSQKAYNNWKLFSGAYCHVKEIIISDHKEYHVPFRTTSMAKRQWFHESQRKFDLTFGGGES